MRVKLLICFLILGLSLWSVDFFETETDHYLIKSTISSDSSAEMAYICEQLLSQFQIVTGEPSKKISRLTLLEFQDKEEFDIYLSEELGINSDYYTLVSRGLLNQTDLIMFREGSDFSLSMMTHLALFQFLEACNSETPSWIKEGLAQHFEMIKFDNQWENDPLIPFNVSALKRLNKIETEDRVNLVTLLTMTEEEIHRNPSLTYPECWGFVSFLMNSPSDMSRLFWEHMTLITLNKKGEWPQQVLPELEESYHIYIASLDPQEETHQTLKGLFEKDYYTKALAYIEEQGLEDSWLGLYYIGLIHHERGLFADALEEYDASEKRGAPLGPISYAKALCLLELNQEMEGKKMLLKAEENQPGIVPAHLNHLLEHR